jgi:hypothetical protein
MIRRAFLTPGSLHEADHQAEQPAKKIAVRRTCVRQRYNSQAMPFPKHHTNTARATEPPRTSPHHHPRSPNPSHSADTRHQILRPLYTVRPARAVWQCPSLAAGTTHRGLARLPTARPKALYNHLSRATWVTCACAGHTALPRVLHGVRARPSRWSRVTRWTDTWAVAAALVTRALGRRGVRRGECACVGWAFGLGRSG